MNNEYISKLDLDIDDPNHQVAVLAVLPCIKMVGMAVGSLLTDLYSVKEGAAREKGMEILTEFFQLVLDGLKDDKENLADKLKDGDYDA